MDTQLQIRPGYPSLRLVAQLQNWSRDFARIISQQQFRQRVSTTQVEYATFWLTQTKLETAWWGDFPLRSLLPAGLSNIWVIHSIINTILVLVHLLNRGPMDESVLYRGHVQKKRNAQTRLLPSSSADCFRFVRHWHLQLRLQPHNDLQLSIRFLWSQTRGRFPFQLLFAILLWRHSDSRVS